MLTYPPVRARRFCARAIQRPMDPAAGSAIREPTRQLFGWIRVRPIVNGGCVLRRCFTTAGIFVVVISSVCIGASRWETTSFTEWTDDVLQELLADSPWAGEASVSRARTSSVGTPPPADEKAVVTWTTALPMREALVREAIGLNGNVTKEAETFLSTTPMVYVVAVKISGGPASASYASLVQEVQKETFLVRTDGRTPLNAFSAEGHALDKSGRLIADVASAEAVEGGTTLFVFQFSKGLALTMLDRDVEFVTKVGTLNIKKKFKMKDMVYKGELAL